MSWNKLEFLGIPNSQNSGNSFRKGVKLAQEVGQRRAMVELALKVIREAKRKPLK